MSSDLDHDEAAARKAWFDASERKGGWKTFWGIESEEEKELKVKYDEVSKRAEQSRQTVKKRARQFPLFKELEKLGFEEGERPSEWECRQKYEAILRQQERRFSQYSPGRYDPYRALGLGGNNDRFGF